MLLDKKKELEKKLILIHNLTMYTKENRGAFDRLVEGLSSDDRIEMLRKLKLSAAPSVQFVETEKYADEENVTLRLKYKSESIFYRIYLWIKSFFLKRSTEEVYNEDILLSIAKQINRDHPGLINYHTKVLDSIFYDRLLALKDAADFLKNYFIRIDENPGDFYIFLSSIVVPELSEAINNIVDPFNLPFNTEPTNEKRNELLRKLDEYLKNINVDMKNRLYKAVCSVNWIKHFSKLPYIHFTVQFTNLIGNTYTCPYKNAKIDYDAFAAVFSDINQVPSEVLEAIFLFANSKGSHKKIDQLDMERSVKEFLATANEHLTSIQMFISCVPIIRLGKVINGSFDWAPEKIEGVESWFKNFRSSWRKIVDIRWNEWVRERKKSMLSINLKEDFNLPEFPVMPNRPWLRVWTKVPFTCDLTGGFLSWFEDACFDDVLSALNVVVMEGVFNNSENRNIFSEGLNNFVQAMTDIRELKGDLALDGEYGTFFAENVDNKIRSFKIQNQIDNTIARIEGVIREASKKFLNGAKMMESVFVNMFNPDNENGPDVLQNFMLVKGHKNREWRDNLRKARETLKKGVFYLSELEPIESGKNV